MMFKINNITFTFSGHSKVFFRNLSASFSLGKIHFIRGRNGVGKSTLFRILRGQVSRDEMVLGSACFGNDCLPIGSSRSVIEKKVCLVQQRVESMLAGSLSGFENLRSAAIGRVPSLAGLPGCDELPSFMEGLGIPMDIPVGLLSGGQRQILAILMALQKSPKVLLLDEPTAALDNNNSRLVMDFLARIARETDVSILIICHDSAIIDEYSSGGCLGLRETKEGREIFYA